MKILKKWSKTIECDTCKCELEYGIEDLKFKTRYTYSTELDNESYIENTEEFTYITCPYCQNKIIINKTIIPYEKGNKEEFYNEKENKNMMNNLLNGMFGKVGNGMCRLSMNGNIAVKTSSGYKTYNLKTGRLTNCDSFVFNIGEEFFFVIPTNKVSEGDIILVNGKPKCVIEAEKNKITVINYEDSTIDTILPERHVFMGNTYFYGKIVSMFGNDAVKGKKGKNNIFKYMMLSQMMNGNDSNAMGMVNSNNSMSAMLPFMMVGGNMGELFDGMFDFDMNDGDEVENSEEEDA